MDIEDGSMEQVVQTMNKLKLCQGNLFLFLQVHKIACCPLVDVCDNERGELAASYR
jgi:hypothetical protein